MPVRPGRLLWRLARGIAHATLSRRPTAVANAAILAFVIALVPDPVTVARAPAAYAPTDAGRFTPVVALDLSASGGDVERAPRAALDAGIPDRGPAVPDAPLGGAPPVPIFDAIPPPLDLGSLGHVGQVVDAWRTTEVSWYGPGFYGKRTACGYAMSQTLVGVAHRTLPCGTLVQFRWRGRSVNTLVVDRGPYVDGRLWDLTAGLCALLDHCYTGPITWKIP